MSSKPPQIIDLMNWLSANHGMKVHEEHESASFGDSVTILAGDGARVRLICDRGVWFVDLGRDNVGGDWHDVPLLVEQATGHIGSDVLQIDEQCELVKANWEQFRAIVSDDASIQDLARRRKERAKRRLPFAVQSKSS